MTAEASKNTLGRDPFGVFGAWYRKAVRVGARLPDAMTLATASPSGKPSARVVLLKGVRDGGFVFFTNYGSRKSNDLRINPRAAMVFYWPETGRQVRIEGRVERIPRRESEEYFRTRPRASRLGAWASPQSSPVRSRVWLDARFGRIAERFGGRPIPCPPFWGGYRLTPDSFEFWIHRGSRLHDRFHYRRARGGWRIARLAP